MYNKLTLIMAATLFIGTLMGILQPAHAQEVDPAKDLDQQIKQENKDIRFDDKEIRKADEKLWKDLVELGRLDEEIKIDKEKIALAKANGASPAEIQKLETELSKVEAYKKDLVGRIEKVEKERRLVLELRKDNEEIKADDKKIVEEDKDMFHDYEQLKKDLMELGRVDERISVLKAEIAYAKANGASAVEIQKMEDKLTKLEVDKKDLVDHAEKIKKDLGKDEKARNRVERARREEVRTRREERRELHKVEHHSK